MPVSADDYKEIYGGRFLKAGDLNGETIRCRVTDVNAEEIHQKDGTKERKMIATLSGAPKSELVLNHTNSGALAAMYGTDPNKWIGAIVDAFTVPTSMGEGIRIKIVKNPKKPDPISSGPQPHDPDLNDEVPFN